MNKSRLLVARCNERVANTCSDFQYKVSKTNYRRNSSNNYENVKSKKHAQKS